MANLVAQDLRENGTYVVIDRQQVEAAWQAQKFSEKDRIDRMAAVRIGKILGADAAVMGEVTRFGSPPRKIGDENWLHRPLLKAFADADVRLVDVDSDLIVAVASGRAESSRTGYSPLSTGNGVWRGFGDGAPDFSNKDFQATLLGEAVNDSATQITKSLDADAARITGKSDPE